MSGLIETFIQKVPFHFSHAWYIPVDVEKTEHFLK